MFTNLAFGATTSQQSMAVIKFFCCIAEQKREVAEWRPSIQFFLIIMLFPELSIIIRRFTPET